MMTVLSKMLPTCRDMARLLSEAMDRTLPWHVRVRMRLHLLMCVLCERYKQQLHFIREALRNDAGRLNLDADPQEPCLSDEAKARIRHALDSHRK